MNVRKKILVASFQRSGTHFLINSLASNLEGVEDGWVDVVNSPRCKWVGDVRRNNLIEKIREHLVDKYYPSEQNKCLKTHFQAYFFERYWEEIISRYSVLYIFRDPRDVMVACYHYYNKTSFEHFVREPCFSKFIRAELWATRTETQPFSYSFTKPRNIIDKWQKHILSWLQWRERGALFVSFAELKRSPGATLATIARFTGYQLKATLMPVTTDDRRYRPDWREDTLARGQVGGWRKYFNEDDFRFLEASLIPQIREMTFVDS
jgi:hypothetical protein